MRKLPIFVKIENEVHVIAIRKCNDSICVYTYFFLIHENSILCTPLHVHYHVRCVHCYKLLTSFVEDVEHQKSHLIVHSESENAQQQQRHH